MKNRLQTGLRTLLVSTAALLSSGCEMCDEMYRAPYYDINSYYQPAPCFSPYYQPVPYYQPINQCNQCIEPENKVHSGNEVPSVPSNKPTKLEPVPQPPKPIPEEIETPKPLASKPLVPIHLNRKSVKATENISKN